MIKITRRLKFNFCDLMEPIDYDHEFTLRDVIWACKNSKIPMDVLSDILQCSYIGLYFDEMQSKKFKDGGYIEYLELSWVGTIYKFGGKEDSGHSWHFNGIGREGIIPEDLLKTCTKAEINKMKKEKWRQGYAVELTPIYELANYSIKVRKEITVADWRDYEKKNHPRDLNTSIDIRPSITLLEVLYWVFWELSFMGSPEKRDKQSKELNERAAEIIKAIDEGRIDEITRPWEEVKKEIKKKFKKSRKYG